MFRFYFEVARTAFRRQLIYRWANLAGVLTNGFFGAIFSYVIIALYQARPTVSGYDVHDALRYTWLVQSLVMTTLTFGWSDLILTIRTGEVVSDLSKPCDFYGYWFSRELGRSAYYFLYRGVPTYAIGVLLFGIGIPDQWQTWLTFSLVFPLGVTLGIAYRFLYNMSAFWIIEARAISTMATVIALFFTGSYVPLPLLPAGLHTLANLLPFAGIINMPVEVLTGKLSGNGLWLALGNQLLWLVIITIVVRKVTAMASQRVVIQGG